MILPIIMTLTLAAAAAGRTLCEPGTQCVGRMCHTATNTTSGIRVHGFDPACKWCRCVPLEQDETVLVTYLAASRFGPQMESYITMLGQSLPYLQENILRYNPHYEVAIFYTNFTNPNLTALHALADHVRCKVSFVDVTHTWQPPDWVTNWTGEKLCKCGELSWPVDYCVMNQFFVQYIFDLPLVQKYTYFFRLDVDTYVTSPFPESPHAIAASGPHDFLYVGYHADDFEFPPCMVGFCDVVAAYPSGNAFDHGYKCNLRWQGQFMFGRIAFFRSEEYRRFITYLMQPEQGGLYKHRWADQDIAPAVFHATGKAHRTKVLYWTMHLTHTKAVPLSIDETPPERSFVSCDDDFIGICEMRHVCIKDDFRLTKTLYFQTAPVGLKEPLVINGITTLNVVVGDHGDPAPRRMLHPTVWAFLCCWGHVTHHMLDDLIHVAHVQREKGIGTKNVAYFGEYWELPNMDDMRTYLLGSHADDPTGENLYINLDPTKATTYCFDKAYLSRNAWSLRTLFGTPVANDFNRSEVRETIRYLANIPPPGVTAREVTAGGLGLRVVIADRTGARAFSGLDELVASLRSLKMIASVEVVVFQHIPILAAVEVMQV